MLVLSPTRELAMQSQEVMEKAGKECEIRQDHESWMKLARFSHFASPGQFAAMEEFPSGNSAKPCDGELRLWLQLLEGNLQPTYLCLC